MVKTTDEEFSSIDIERKERLKFIKKCRKKYVTTTEIAKILNISRQRLYQVERYGYVKSGFSRKWYAREIVKIEKKCRLCGSIKNLIAHHIYSPKKQSFDNLMTLCQKCHFKVEKLKKEEKKDYKQFVKEVRHPKTALQKSVYKYLHEGTDIMS